MVNGLVFDGRKGNYSFRLLSVLFGHIFHLNFLAAHWYSFFITATLKRATEDRKTDTVHLSAFDLFANASAADR